MLCSSVIEARKQRQAKAVVKHVSLVSGTRLDTKRGRTGDTERPSYVRPSDKMLCLVLYSISKLHVIIDIRDEVLNKVKGSRRACLECCSTSLFWVSLIRRLRGLAGCVKTRLLLTVSFLEIASSVRPWLPPWSHLHPCWALRPCSQPPVPLSCPARPCGSSSGCPSSCLSWPASAPHDRGGQ